MKRKQIRRLVILYFLLVTAGMVWPVYPLFSRIEPLLLGIPFGMFYLIVLLLASFLVLLLLYLWEEHWSGQD